MSHRHPTDRWLGWVERGSLVTLGVGCALTLAFAAASIWLTTIELDEAWLLFGLASFFRDAPPGSEIPVVLTSAGAYAAIHVAIEWVAAGDLWAHRLASLVSLAAFLALAYRANGKGPRAASWLCAGAAASTPGAVLLGSQAFGEVIALLLVLAYVETAFASGKPIARCLLGGALLGLACATRTSVLPMLPALMLFWGLRPDRTRAQLAETLATIGLAIAAFAGFQALFLVVSPGEPPSAQYVLGVSGASNATHFEPVMLFNRMLLGRLLAPLGLAMACFVGALWAAERSAPPFGSRPLLLACLALGQLAAWALLSPKAHLRYAWPGLPLLWLSIGMLAALTWTHARAVGLPLLRALVASGVAGCLASELVAASRVLAYGESTLITAEYAGLAPIRTYDPFAAVDDQRAAIRFLRDNVEQSERVWVLHLPFELAYTTGLNVGTFDPRSPRAHWIALTPMIGTQAHASDAVRAWIERNCELRARFGGYSIYRIVGGEELPSSNPTALSAHPL